MKIITICIKNSKTMRGGAYKRYMELINGFLLKGWEVHHFSPHGFSSIFHENLHHHGVSEIPINPNYIPFMLQVIPKSILTGWKNEIDAIVTFAIFDALVGIIFKIFHRKTKVILCDRGDSIKGFMIDMEKNHRNNFLKSSTFSLLKYVEKFIYNNVDLIIFNSTTRKEEVKNFKILNTPLKTIFNNANPSWVTEKEDIAKLESIKIRDKWRGKRILCFIGNLFINGRDLNTLIKAFKLVNEIIPDTVLLIVGEGPDKQKLIKIINSEGLTEHVSIEGWKDNPFSYMLAADINLVTALHEGCSNTILESIYFGVVMLGSNVGGIVKLLKYKELLFSPKSPVELSELIIKLLKNEDELSNAKKLIESRKEKFVFDWNEKMINSIENVDKV